MKPSEMRALLNQAYDTLDHAPGAAAERALAVLTHAPKEPESYLLMAEVAQENQRSEQALMWIERGLMRHPHHAGLLIKKASILIDDFEDLDEAYELLTKLHTSLKDFSHANLKQEYGSSLLGDLYLLLTDVMRLKCRYTDALGYAMLAQEFVPLDDNALLAVATAHFELGDYTRALLLIEPVETRKEPADFYRLKALILCAEGQFSESDAAFYDSHRLNKAAYHRPHRLSQEHFLGAFDQAIMALPREIRTLIETCAVEVSDILSVDRVQNSNGTLSPQACITIDDIKVGPERGLRVINLFQKNIENLALKKEDIKDIIASALLHELGTIVISPS